MTEVLGILLMMAALAGLLLGLVVAARPLPWRGLNRRRFGGFIAAGAVATFIAGGLIMDSAGPASAAPDALRPATRTTTSSAPPSVAKADPSIRSVVEEGDTLTIDTWSEQWSDKDHLFMAGNLVEAVGVALQAGASDGGAAPTVEITISTGSVDRLGNKGEMYLAILAFNREDLMAAKFENLTVGQTLNLAKDVRFGPAGARIILAYCLTDRGHEQSRPFCALADSKTP